MYRRAFENDDELADDPPQEYNHTHYVQASPEPDVLRREDARVEEEDRGFHRGNRGGVEILEYIEAEIPFLGCIWRGDLDVFAEAVVGCCDCECYSERNGHSLLLQETDR